MGNLQASEMANSGLPLRAQLHWHLTSNHYPPLPDYMVGVAERAIDLANEGEWDGLIELPAGVTRADTGERWVPVWKLVESLHLDAWVEGSEA
jgi:hypothetical protein